MSVINLKYRCELHVYFLGRVTHALNLIQEFQLPNA